MGIGDWGLGIGDWGLGGWAQTPTPHPQPPTPHPPPPHFFFKNFLKKKKKITKKNLLKILK